ncbi:MAG: glycosyltransferase [Bacteroidia bacterium]|nr:glycosyltransferase [Bacteroidia bacterium]
MNRPDISMVKYSVIVPFRNEPEMGELITCLSKQSISFSDWELLLISDHNSELELEAVKEMVRLFPRMNISVFPLPEDLQGKKAALTFGISKATGGIVLTTDADCRPSGAWISEMTAGFSNHSVKMIVGNVRMIGAGGLLAAYQELEHFAFYTISAFSCGWGNPRLCTGASLAFRKSCFFEVNGYEGNEKISSGDDMFLMRKMAGSPGAVLHAGAREATVLTFPALSQNQFFAQRLRWLSKMHSFSDQNALSLFVVDTIVKVMLFLMPLVFGALGYWEWVYFIPLFIRWFIDFLLVLLPSIRFRRMAMLIWSVPAFLMSVWVQSRLLAGLINKPELQWKGRVVVDGR